MIYRGITIIIWKSIYDILKMSHVRQKVRSYEREKGIY